MSKSIDGREPEHVRKLRRIAAAAILFERGGGEAKLKEALADLYGPDWRENSQASVVVD